MVLFGWPFNFFYFPHVLEVGIPIIMFKLGLVKLDPKCIKTTVGITFGAYTVIHLINLAINNAQLLDFNGEVIKVYYMFSIYSLPTTPTPCWISSTRFFPMTTGISSWRFP